MQAWLKPNPIGLLIQPTRHLFFTGKGGVGNTSLSTAAALTLADELAAASQGLIMVMGKGGVGKTTVAAALALGLIQRGKTVHIRCCCWVRPALTRVLMTMR